MAILLPLLAVPVTGAEPQPVNQKKIAVLLVNHGSRSETWRKSLLNLEERVRPGIMGNGRIQGLRTAFMEYTEPSIATRLEEFDAEGFTDVILVPVFLTVSPHTFDDIPTIVGKKTDPKSLEMLKLEKIRRYQPKANVVIAPNLDFPGVLKENILRRARQLSREPKEEGLVLIAYGDETYEKEWAGLLGNVAEHVKQQTGIDAYSYGWCGHVAHYDPARTTEAVQRVLATKSRALVIPVLVAHDEQFQIKIIGGGIGKVPEYGSRVAYVPDAILPDENIQKWVTEVAIRYADELAGGTKSGLAKAP